MSDVVIRCAFFHEKNGQISRMVRFFCCIRIFRIKEKNVHLQRLFYGVFHPNDAIRHAAAQ